jgi:Uma2 family endonuclease
MPAASVTAEELLARPREDRRWELQRGCLVPMSPVNFEHGRVVMQLDFLLKQHLAGGRAAGVAGTEIGFILERGPDTVRAPDVAFVRQERVPPRDARGFFVGPPDLAVEVLSPDDRQSDVQAKVDEYLSHGVSAVLVVDPAARTARVARPSAAAIDLAGDSATIGLDDVVPGFRCTLGRVFE